MTANEQLNYLSTEPRKAEIKKVENEQLTKIQKGLEKNIDGGLLGLMFDDEETKKLKEKIKGYINHHFDKIQSLFLEKRRLIKYWKSQVSECNDYWKKKLKEQQERIIQLCNNIDTLEANKDAYKKQCEEQEKEIERLKKDNPNFINYKRLK